MTPEARMRDSDVMLAEVHVENVKRIKAEADQSSKAELNALVAGAGLASRRVSGALAMSRKGVADLAKAAAASQAPAANENDIDAKLETEMDDHDFGRTPERVEQVRAEIRRRLGLVEAARESKSVAEGGALAAGGALPGEVASASPAPDAPA